MKFLNIFQLLWVIFALLGPDPVLLPVCGTPLQILTPESLNINNLFQPAWCPPPDSPGRFYYLVKSMCLIKNGNQGRILTPLRKVPYPQYTIFFRTTGPPASDPRRASVSGDLVSSSWERTGRRSPAHQRRHASAREAGCPALPRSPRCLLMTQGGASVESVFEDPEEETYSYLEVG
jgi:hypothetical protein